MERDKREIYEKYLLRSLSACGGFGILNFADKSEIYEVCLTRSLSACGGFGILNFADKSEIYAKFVLAKEVYYA